jgi:hypothetical protein
MGDDTATPPRRPGSIRRTTSVDVSWPDGRDGLVRFEATGRDVLTGDAGGFTVMEHVTVTVDVNAAERRVAAVDAPTVEGASGVAGARVGREVREAMVEHMSADVTRGAPVVQLLDDLTGAWIVAAYALYLWGQGDTGVLLGSTERRQMAGVCLGFSPGSSAFAPDGGVNDRHMSADVVDLVDPDDPGGWHRLPERHDMSLRRARRLDVSLSGDDLVIDSMFQDSSTQPSGGRAGVHQYGVTAQISRDDLVLRRLDADPRILPYGECPMAMLGLSGLAGTPLLGLRDVVPARLPGVHGCTHLNDAVRALSLVQGHALAVTSGLPPADLDIAGEIVANLDGWM